MVTGRSNRQNRRPLLFFEKFRIRFKRINLPVPRSRVFLAGLRAAWSLLS